MEELFLMGIGLAALLVVLPWTALALASLFVGFPRLRLSQLAGMVLVAAWFSAIFSIPGNNVENQVIVTVMFMLPVIGGMWIHELRTLMVHRDDEFPGRFDKLIWSLALLFFAPAAVWLFRHYRRTQWPSRPALAKRRDEQIIDSSE
jgi:hypothetical protein